MMKCGVAVVGACCWADEAPTTANHASGLAAAPKTTTRPPPSGHLQGSIESRACSITVGHHRSLFVDTGKPRGQTQVKLCNQEHGFLRPSLLPPFAAVIRPSTHQPPSRFTSTSPASSTTDLVSA